MSLFTLPEEVLETILLHLNTEDVSSVLTVVGIEGREGFWKRICLQNGYKKLLSEDETWKCVFHRNITWLKGTYLKKEYNISELPISDSNPRENAQPKSVLMGSDSVSSSIVYFVNFPEGFGCNFFLKKNKLLSQKQDEVLLMDVENPKILLQKLRGRYHDWYDLSRKKLLIRTSSSLVVYSSDKDHYKKLFVLNGDDFFHTTPYVLTDDYFAILRTGRGVDIVDLNNMEEYSLLLPLRKGIASNMSVNDRILNLVIVTDENSYVLRRYDLGRREWLEDIPLFGNIAMIEIPRVKMNQRYIVSWSLLFDDGGATLLKIWTLGDNASQRTSNLIQLRPENVLWLVLAVDYVVYSSSKTSFSIFNMNEPDKIESMAMCENDYLGQNIISNFMVLSYTNCFKLVDFKKATYLYEVLFDSGFEYKQFCVNEYFYVAYNSNCRDEGHNKLCIYDFRSQRVSED